MSLKILLLKTIVLLLFVAIKYFSSQRKSPKSSKRAKKATLKEGDEGYDPFDFDEEDEDSAPGIKHFLNAWGNPLGLIGSYPRENANLCKGSIIR